MSYISREEALACFTDWIDRYGHEHSADEMVEYQRIEDLPEEDVRPVVRGEWVSVHDRYGICSNCHRGDHIDPLAGFCRFCGADMKKKGGKDGV